ncbi:class II glutamine amidotransferase [Bacteriovoracaceae bacterium]|nr:class II glutamine amidotransferase [Bacteriovoracaceae bacterium]
MCRFVAYIGDKIPISELLFKPQNSLIEQSKSSKERVDPTNGDGFGVGWYNRSMAEEPALFRSIQPAWNDQNLRSIAPTIKAKIILAHVRAATFGDVSQENCHPFQHGNVLFMHNGDIDAYGQIKRELAKGLDDEMYNWLVGTTDSALFFAMLMSNLPAKCSWTGEIVYEAYQQTINEIIRVKKDRGLSLGFTLNTVFCDGAKIFATRFSTDPSTRKPPTMYYSQCAHTTCDQSRCRFRKKEGNQTFLTSEKFNQCGEWDSVPINSFIMVDQDHKMTFTNMNISV